jgi:5-methylcytosine-specific restriction endonuclease McrA
MSDVLVLNYDYTPLNVTSINRGFVLVSKGRAEIIKSYENPITSGFKTYVRPLIIRLLNYVKHKINGAKANRIRILKRDNYQCVYCGSKKNLTLDHVMPRSRGGGNEWTNLVTSCLKCNLTKGNKTPEEAKMVMSQKPFVPTLIENYGILQKIWEEHKNHLFN